MRVLTFTLIVLTFTLIVVTFTLIVLTFTLIVVAFTLVVSTFTPPLWRCLQGLQDVEEEEMLEAVEAAVRESGSVKKISVECRDLAWTNVATAILKGATDNQSLRELALQMLRINVEEW